MMPVSSSTSRTAACSAVSPSSMWPLGSDHSSRPRRSMRPISGGRRRAVVVDDQAARRGLVDRAQPSPAIDGTACAATARATAGGGHAPMVTSSATSRRCGATWPARPRRPVAGPRGRRLDWRRRVRCSAHRVRPISRAAQEDAVVELVDRPPGRRRARRPVRRRRAPAVPGRRHRARRAARPARAPTSTSPPTRGPTQVLAAASTAGPTRCGTPASRSARSARGAAATTGGDHHLPRRRLRPRDAATRSSPSATRSTTTWSAATSPSTRWRCELDRRRRAFVDPFGGLAALASGVLRHARHAGGVVRRRPAADAARRPVRRPARVHAGAAGRRGDDRDGRASWSGSPPSGCGAS